MHDLSNSTYFSDNRVNHQFVNFVSLFLGMDEDDT